VLLITRDAPSEAIHFAGSLVAPSDTADEIVDAYYRQISVSFAQPNTQSRLQQMGLDVVMMPPKEFGRFIANEVVKWGAVVKAAGAQLE
jgi:tripartite-type tricarboxylate transporter receptor subunit TctC